MQQKPCIHTIRKFLRVFWRTNIDWLYVTHTWANIHDRSETFINKHTKDVKPNFYGDG